MENQLNKKSFFFEVPKNISFLIKDNILYIKKSNNFDKFVLNFGQLSIKNSLLCLTFPTLLWDEKKQIKIIVEFSNFLKGISKGFYITLKFNGIGYRIISINKHLLKIKIGYNKPIEIAIPSDIEILVLNRLTFLVKSNNLKKLRNFVIKIRKIRKPDIYKAKGIQYLNETFKLKEIKKVL